VHYQARPEGAALTARNGDEGPFNGNERHEWVVRPRIEKIPMLDAPLFLRAEDTRRNVWNSST
jgi:hypothetical protein